MLYSYTVENLTTGEIFGEDKNASSRREAVYNILETINYSAKIIHLKTFETPTREQALSENWECLKDTITMFRVIYDNNQTEVFAVMECVL